MAAYMVSQSSYVTLLSEPMRTEATLRPSSLTCAMDSSVERRTPL